MKGTFNQGWWNCFESFTAEILGVDKYASAVSRRVLEGAGITKREAKAWLDKEGTRNPAVVEIVMAYYYSI